MPLQCVLPLLGTPFPQRLRVVRVSAAQAQAAAAATEAKEEYYEVCFAGLLTRLQAGT